MHGDSVAKYFKNHVVGTSKYLKQVVCAAALAMGGVAHADVLNFEGNFDSPFLFNGDHVQVGNYWIETYGGAAGPSSDLAGAIVNGSDPGSCFAVACPANNPTQYYTGLDDGYFYFGKADDALFRLTGLKASFIGNGQSSFPLTAGLLVIQGFDALDRAVGAGIQVPLAGPNAQGVFNFSSFSLLNNSNIFSYVRVLGYACDALGNCNRSSNLANFAIDDISTQAVPEPGTMALFGLGMAGLGLMARRRRSA